MTRGNSSSPSSQFCECPSPMMAFLPMNLMHSDKALGKIYPWRKVVCLFCFVPWRSNELLRYFRSCSWSLWKTLKERGVHQLSFILVFGLAFRSSWMIFSLNITLNRSWNFFQRNWNVPLISLERSWRARFNGIYLVRFGFRMIIPPCIISPSL